MLRHTLFALVATCQWLQHNAQSQPQRKEREGSTENPGDRDMSNLCFLPAPNFLNLKCFTALLH